MFDRNRRILIAGAALLLAAAYAMPTHRANIQILAAEEGDANPHRVQAAVDIGLVAVNILVTWTSRLAR